MYGYVAARPDLPHRHGPHRHDHHPAVGRRAGRPDELVLPSDVAELQRTGERHPQLGVYWDDLCLSALALVYVEAGEVAVERQVEGLKGQRPGVSVGERRRRAGPLLAPQSPEFCIHSATCDSAVSARLSAARRSPARGSRSGARVVGRPDLIAREPGGNVSVYDVRNGEPGDAAVVAVKLHVYLLPRANLGLWRRSRPAGCVLYPYGSQKRVEAEEIDK